MINLLGWKENGKGFETGLTEQYEKLVTKYNAEKSESNIEYEQYSLNEKIKYHGFGKIEMVTVNK